MGLLEIEGLTHSFGENLLYKNVDFSLNRGEHIGVVGQNGTGKSTLIKICTEQIMPDAGRVVWQPNVSVGYLDQYAEIEKNMTMQSFLKSAFSRLYQLEREMTMAYERAAMGDMEYLSLAAKHQEQLEIHDFYSIDTQIEQVANGLGLSAIGLDRPIDKMSGGQRAKVILAKLLLEKPDVLLLDEPTNFLDKEHITWLSDYLSGLDNAFMVVSHDYAFLEKIANRICDIDNDNITKYYGTYSEFLRKKTLLREDYVRQYSAQQKEIKKTEEFIRKNIAGRKSKMARGRRKQLERMEKMEALDQKEITPYFHFPEVSFTNTEHLLVKGEDTARTPIQIVSDSYPDMVMKEVRKALALCGISSKHAMQPVGTLSGGEQAKVKMCLLTLKPCNFLILEEPTNHLDIQAKDALKTALVEFAGTILLVSHEEIFYREWADRVIDIEKQG